MDISILKSFSPEIFLSISILFQLVFNARFVNNLKFNYPVIDREIFFQTFFIVVCLIMLLINICWIFTSLTFVNLNICKFKPEFETTVQRVTISKLTRNS